MGEVMLVYPIHMSNWLLWTLHQPGHQPQYNKRARGLDRNLEALGDTTSTIPLIWKLKPQDCEGTCPSQQGEPGQSSAQNPGP